MTFAAPASRARTPHHRAAALCLLALSALLAGCHHASHTYSAANYPPPPPSAPPTPMERPATRVPARPSAPAPPRPTQPDDLTAAPISTEVGLASWYGPPYHHRAAADGSIFDQNALTAAHRTLPMGTTVRVTNLASNESVIVKITDRGPFVPNRILDLSLAAAKSIDLYRAGVARVRVEAFPHTSADPAGRWCVQIGTFLTQEDATQTKNDLASRYTAAKVITFQGPTGFWVRINPTAADRTTATRIADSIHIPDADPYLVRLN